MATTDILCATDTQDNNIKNVLADNGEFLMLVSSGIQDCDYDESRPCLINRCKERVIDFGSRTTFIIDHDAYYLQSVMFVVEFDNDDMSIYVDDIADAIIRYAEIEIGGSCISRVTNDITHIWNGLTGKKNQCIGNKLYITVPFDVFPIHLYLLTLHEVRINIELEDKINLVKRKEDADKCKIKNIYLHEQKYMLGTPPTNRTHNEKIKQWQIGEYNIGTSMTDNNTTQHFVNFENICDELFWVYVDEEALKNKHLFGASSVSNKYFNYISLANKCVLSMLDCKLSNPDDAYFYQNVQQLNHHTSQMNDVYVYSFTPNPEKKEEVGQCNFSRLNRFSIESVLNDNPKQNKCKLKVFAKTNNILRYHLGIGGCLFSL